MVAEGGRDFRDRRDSWSWRRWIGSTPPGGWITGTATVLGSLAAVGALFIGGDGGSSPRSANLIADRPAETAADGDYRDGVASICDFLADSRAGADRRHPKYARGVSRAPTYEHQQAAAQREAQLRVDVANEVVDRLTALSPPGSLKSLHSRLLVTAESNANRFQGLRDSIQTADSYRKLRRVFRRLRKTPFEHDRRTIDGLLKRLAYTRCRLPSDTSPPLVRLRPPKDHDAAGLPPDATQPDASPQRAPASSDPSADLPQPKAAEVPTRR